MLNNPARELQVVERSVLKSMKMSSELVCLVTMAGQAGSNRYLAGYFQLAGVPIEVAIVN